MYNLYLQIIEIWESVLSYIEESDEDSDILLDKRAALDELATLKRKLRKFDPNRLDVTHDFKAQIITKINTIKGDIDTMQTDINHRYYYDEYFEELKISIYNYLKDTMSSIDSNSEARRLTDYLLDPSNIDIYLTDIKKIVKGVMPKTTFRNLYSRFLIKTKTYNKIFKQGTYESLKLSEGFFNPYEKKEEEKKEPIHLSDSGEFLSKRREFFDKSGIEYQKSKGGYTIYAKKSFDKGDIIETCPTILVSKEYINDTLDNLAFELDENKYALVLGYGSLYKHSFTPNIDYAFNNSNKQMYFIAKTPIKKGDELSINYGDDYIVKHSQNENSDSANVGDQAPEIFNGGLNGIGNVRAVSSPVNPNNPAYTGLPTLGAQF